MTVYQTVLGIEGDMFDLQMRSVLDPISHGWKIT